ncbi:hypothetical protein HYD67_00870 [Mycoplasmopsis bovis]|nr:hypothetical protein [Mycoplasmopsis bovis]QQH54802.1 hypothetical protein HYD67_00870 [Mycoplasmopsis bovis]
MLLVETAGSIINKLKSNDGSFINGRVNREDNKVLLIKQKKTFVYLIME